MSGKCSIAQSRVSPAVYGEEHLKPRLKTIHGLVAIREDRPKVPTSEFLVDVWNRMRYDFEGACLDGVRRIIRSPHPGAKRDKVGRLSWGPREDGTPMWQFPGNFPHRFRYWALAIYHCTGVGA